MVRGRAGGGGAPFNLGEMTVTRCTVRTEAGFVGHAYIAGREDRARRTGRSGRCDDAGSRSRRRNRSVGSSPRWKSQQAQQEAARAAKAAATRVQFFAMQTMRT